MIETGDTELLSDGAAGDARDLRLGAQIDRYTIVRLLGRGGMGTVYEARHTRLTRRVAMKFLLPELAARPEILRRFDNEAMAAGALEHPNLVAVLDLGRAVDGAPYLVMEYLQGEDCARLLRQSGPLPAPRAVDIVLQACRGVAVAHAAGIIHRDLKPANLFVTDAGDGSDQIKVLDFGIAKLRPVDGEAATGTGSTFGTTHYMSPEQARGAADVDPRTDVWSLGVVLYELLGGRRPFDGEQPLNVVHQIFSVAPVELETLRPGLPAGLAAVVAKAMEKDVARRFATIRELADALAPFAAPAILLRNRSQDGGVTMPTPVTAARPAQARGPRAGRRLGTVLAVAAVVAVAAFIITRPKVVQPSPSLAASPAAPEARVEPPPVPRATPTPDFAIDPPTAKVSEQSGRSIAVTSTRARSRSHGLASRASMPTTVSGSASAPVEAAKPPFKLDPNPY
ncbi:MAG TPA: protein kinase [Polyangia bacterium]|nr:protein kinase [Polyangia bacterium]